ncbi:MAG TPA: hypothetical protein EYG48_00820 [Methylococcales bacterium]|nr:hypothetical protein [Methylococcales bacterium]
MFEFIIVLVLIFAAYIMFFKDKSDTGQPNKKEDDEAIFNPPENKPAKVEVSTAVVVQSPPEKSKPVAAANSKVKPEPKTTPTPTPKPKSKSKSTSPKVELRTVMMKNPATGEDVKVAGNYRMVKRWIKEALVEEGLLGKIYKNNELDEAAKVVVAEALSIIKAMDKYKV